MVSYAQFVDLLEQHGVHEPVMEVLLWESPKRSALFLLGGITLFLLVHVAHLGMLTVIGTLAILQLFVYRTCEALQNKSILFSKEVNLRDTIVLTPDASSISTSIELVGDVLRMIEEEIKEISLTANYLRLGGAVTILILGALVGRFVALPTLLVLAYVAAFTLPLLYLKNQEAVDQLHAKLTDKLEEVLGKFKKD